MIYDSTTVRDHSVAELIRYRELLGSLTWRDLRVRYKQTLLGFAWAVLLPLSMTVVFAFVFTRAVGAYRTFDVNMPYALYAFAGLAPWTFFSNSLGGCVNALVSNRNLVTKVYFPRQVFPLSCIASASVDFLLSLLILAAMGIYYHLTYQWRIAPDWPILFVPIVIVVQVILTAGLGLILSAANLFYRDVRQVFGVAIQLWMFVSAVVVPIPSAETSLGRLIRLNPLVPLMEAYRDGLLRGRWPDAGGFLTAAAISVLVFVLGWRLFTRSSDRFAECI
jgi:ABC-type polysaccharide/polyol phosphate export permease